MYVSRVLTTCLICFAFDTILQMIQMKLKDSRIKMMNEVLNGIKVCTLCVWCMLYLSDNTFTFSAFDTVFWVTGVESGPLKVLFLVVPIPKVCYH